MALPVRDGRARPRGRLVIIAAVVLRPGSAVGRVCCGRTRRAGWDRSPTASTSGTSRCSCGSTRPRRASAAPVAGSAAVGHVGASASVSFVVDRAADAPAEVAELGWSPRLGPAARGTACGAVVRGGGSSAPPVERRRRRAAEASLRGCRKGTWHARSALTDTKQYGRFAAAAGLEADRAETGGRHRQAQLGLTHRSRSTPARRRR